MAINFLKWPDGIFTIELFNHVDKSKGNFAAMGLRFTPYKHNSMTDQTKHKNTVCLVCSFPHEVYYQPN
jgi:hypothetical protein